MRNFLLIACLVVPLFSSINIYGRQQQINQTTLRVLTYNIHHANPPAASPGTIDVDTIAAVIRQQQPHLVALQEVDVHTKRSRNMDEAALLGAKLGMHVYFGKAINYDGGEYGVAILSKFPVRETVTFPLPSDADTTAEPRVLAMCTVVLPGGKTIRFASTHLDVKSAANRDLQIKAIVNIASQQHLPFILAGDLNAMPQSNCIQILDRHFTRTCTTCAPTIPVNQPSRAIDFIAFRPGSDFSVIDHRVIPERYASDHLPVVAELVIQFADKAQTDTILQRYQSWLYDIYPQADISQYINTYDASRQWTDIDYNDQQPANWQVSQHLKRVRAMAVAWSRPASEWYHDTKLWQIMQGALGHWFQRRYQSTNWWHNKIGVPQVMRDIMVLLRHSLSKDQMDAALQVIAQYGSWQKHTGANLAWSADIALHYGALTNNDSIIQTAARYLINEIKISTGEGIQPDYSFHQHGPRLQMYHYGAGFLGDNVRLAWQLRGTAWQYPAEKIRLLSDFVLHGWQWMARGIHTVPGAIDRSASRPDALQGADIRQLVPYLCAIDPANKKRFLAIADRQNGKGKPLIGFRYYPRSDLAVHHTSAFSFFLKTISTRTLTAETINNENLQGQLLNSGDACIIKDGKEYFNLMPVWDWKRLPGVTIFGGAARINRSPWVGSVADGKSGASVMDYVLQDDKGATVTAKKSWFCHKEQVICLIAGLRKNNVTGEVVTTLDQCRRQGPVRVNTNALPVAEGNHTLDSVHWIHHAGIGYIFLKPELLTVNLTTNTGEWQTINASVSLPPVTEKIFMPVLHHTGTEGSTNTGYVLAACKSPAKAAAIARNPPWSIVRNDTLCQAVRWKDGTMMLAFHQKASVQMEKNRFIEVNKPCLLLIKGKALYASNPLGQEEKVLVRVNREEWQIPLPANGFTSERANIQ